MSTCYSLFKKEHVQKENERIEKKKLSETSVTCIYISISIRTQVLHWTMVHILTIITTYIYIQ